MENYLIAVDMDGTLLDSKNQISEYTLNVLQKVLERGHIIVPASGRALSLLPCELKELEKVSYAVTENGAFVWDYRKEKALSQKTLLKESVEYILQDVRGKNCFTELFSEGMAYTEKDVLSRLHHTVQGENFIRYFSENHIFVENLLSEKALLEKTEKINLYFENLKEASELRKKWQKDTRILVTSSVGDNVEITPAGVNKGMGVLFLIEYLHIPKDRVLVFGDQENDIEMFEMAGHAVAMANARKDVKERADYVTTSCDEDGVAVFLERFLLGKEDKNGTDTCKL